MSVEAGETPLALFHHDEAAGNHVIALSAEGRAARLRRRRNARHVQGARRDRHGPDKGEKLLAAAVTRLTSVTVSGIGRGGRKKALEIKGEKLRHHVGHRARMGRVLPEKPSRRE